MAKSIYWISRENYNKKYRDTYDRHRAADKLGLTYDALTKIERDGIEPLATTVRNMSNLYKDPGLIKRYFMTTLGHDVDVFDRETSSLFHSSYGLMKLNDELDVFKVKLFDILEDGKVTDDETKQLEKMLPDLQKIQKTLLAVEEDIIDRINLK